MKKMKLTKVLLACGLAMGFLGNTQADTLTTTFNVSANIINSCTLTATDMVFGDVVLSVGATATSEVTLYCPAAITGAMRLNGGNNLVTGQRQLAQTINSTEHFVIYNLYSDSALTEPFDPNTSSTTGVGGVSFSTEGGNWIIPIYGEIPSQNSRPGGVYTDIVTATVDW